MSTVQTASASLKNGRLCNPYRLGAITSSCRKNTKEFKEDGSKHPGMHARIHLASLWEADKYVNEIKQCAYRSCRWSTRFDIFA